MYACGTYLCGISMVPFKYPHKIKWLLSAKLYHGPGIMASELFTKLYFYLWYLTFTIRQRT